TLNSNLKSEVYNDTIKLLDYAFDNFQRSSISEGTIFMSEEQEYKTGKKSYYTHSQDDKVSQEISDNGILGIINQDDIVIASLPLEKTKKDNNMMNTPNKITSEEKKNANEQFEIDFIIRAIYGLLTFFIIIIFIFQTRKTLF